MSRITILSLWRNDSDRNLIARAEHLVSKREAYDNLRLVWSVGDCQDDTFEELADWVVQRGYQDWIRVLYRDTGISGIDTRSRLRRLSASVNEGLRYINGSDYVALHESDLISPPDLIPRFLAHAEAGRCPIAGWPILYYGPRPLFYDIWAYRKDGQRFRNTPPYHPSINGDDLFTVDSFGSCWMARHDDMVGLRMCDQAVLDACNHWRNLGRELWVDKTIVIEQPVSLWVPQVA